MERFCTHKKHQKHKKQQKVPKSTKKHQKHKKYKNATKQKYENVNKQTKIKNVLKNIWKEKSILFAYLCFFVFCACEEKKI